LHISLKKINANTIYEQTVVATETLTDCMFHVIAFISASNKVNRNIFQKLRNESLNFTLKNMTWMKIFFLLFDTVHLIKSVRNNWLNYVDHSLLYPSLPCVLMTVVQLLQVLMRFPLAFSSGWLFNCEYDRAHSQF